MISKDILDKMDHARRFLAAPAPEVVGDLIAEIRILTAQRDEAVNNYETAQLLSIRVGEQRDRLADACRNLIDAKGWYNFMIAFNKMKDVFQSLKTKEL